jgi:hypothetical protein
MHRKAAYIPPSGTFMTRELPLAGAKKLLFDGFDITV